MRVAEPVVLTSEQRAIMRKTTPGSAAQRHAVERTVDGEGCRREQGYRAASLERHDRRNSTSTWSWTTAPRASIPRFGTG